MAQKKQIAAPPEAPNLYGKWLEAAVNFTGGCFCDINRYGEPRADF